MTAFQPVKLKAMQNLEAKFRLLSLSRAITVAEQIGFVRRGELTQRDTFFDVPHGNLKLREEPTIASLIHYQRAVIGELDLSNYSIVAVTDAAATRAMLAAATAVLAEVRKRRLLFMRRRIRLHLDEVEALGTFGEIEAVLEPGEDASNYQAEVREILAQLGVAVKALINRSYFELLLAGSLTTR